MDFKSWIETNSLRIRAGEGHAVRVALMELVRKHKVPRRFVADVGQIAWRANLPQIALRLLQPIVHPSDRKFEVATEKEKAEYAAALIKEGAVQEGIQLLHGLPKNEYAPALLYEAFGLVARWDYAATIPLLVRYRALPELTVYQRMVSDVNLVAAYVFVGDYPNADRLLVEALGQATGPSFALARARLLELKAESLIARQKYAEANQVLDEASSHLSDRGAIDHLFIRKYQAIIKVLEAPAEEALSHLEAIRTEALQREHWETLRDLERVTALKLHDSALFARVYYGSPHEGFRATLLKQKPADVTLPDYYEWSLSGEGPNDPVLDLKAGTWQGKKLSGFKEGMANHRLLTALCSDFYRPFRIASLFARAFPGERYIPNHSSVRVRKAISRLREWLKVNKIPLQIVEAHDEYRISALQAVRVGLGRDSQPQGRKLELLAQLKELAVQKPVFSSADAAKVLSLSHRSAQRLLSDETLQSSIERVGNGKSCLYRLAA